MIDIDAIMNFSIDKSDWKKVKFGDVVFEPKESVKDPVAEGIEHIVGLEHIDSEDIHLRRSASIEKSTTFTKKFSKGDVLFGRRRAYLKKAVKADFEGICSGDITVMRARENLLPELLPFIVNNEKFFDFAITHSAGGLSPRVRFKDLARFEFLLPSIKAQGNIVQLLLVCSTAFNKEKECLYLANIFYQSVREQLSFNLNGGNLTFHSKLKADIYSDISFSELGNSLITIKYGTSKKANSENTGYPVLGIPNVINEELTLNDLSYVELKDNEYDGVKLNRGDIVIVRTNGNPEYTGRSALYDLEEGYVFASYLIKITVNTEIYDPEFIVRYLQSKIIRRYFKRHATSSAGNYNINTETIKSIPVPEYTLAEQKNIVKELELIESSVSVFMEATSRTKIFFKKLCEQVF